VTLNNVQYSPTFFNHTRITFALPAGEGVNLPIRVTVSGFASPAVLFSYNPPILSPAVSALNPLTGPTQGNILLTVNGVCPCPMFPAFEGVAHFVLCCVVSCRVHRTTSV
jgi:hypothetical protein